MAKSVAYNTLKQWRRLKYAALNERWVLTCFRWGNVHYYRGSKKWPTKCLANAHTFATGAVAAKAITFMHSGAAYRPVKVTDRMLFKGMLIGEPKK